MKYATIKTRGITSQKLTTQSAMMTDAVLNSPYDIKTVALGRMISSTTMSFEKRVSMRPMGFESKNKTLARTIVLAIALCMLVVLRINMLAMENSRARAARKLRPISAPSVCG